MEILVITFLFFSVSNAKIPDWAARDGTKLNGSVLTTVCHGTGPSLDIARSEALKSCQSSASQYFKSKIKIKSLSVETERSVGFHQEITSNDEIEGLLCDPIKDEIEELDSQFNIWIKCNFDLRKISVIHADQIFDSPDNSNLNNLELSKIKLNPDIQGKYIFISTVPKCESAIIKGVVSRTIQCRQNPLKIQINDSDQEIIIRAKGYKPKIIKIKGVKVNETIQVLLDIL